MSEKYDLVVLGTGNAGMRVAGVAREAGWSVAMVESRDVGGTCPIRGCVPKKVLVAAAQVLHQIDLAAAHHIEVGAPKLNWPQLIARERTFVDGVPESFTKSLANRGIELIEGAAQFVGANQISVGDRTLDAKHILIATGSTPRQLPIPGAEHLIDSDDILENTEQPKSLIFIGGGVIALEFSHVFARAGTKVTILEAQDQLLPRNDTDAVAQIHKQTEMIGVDILTGVSVDKIETDGSGMTVSFTHDDQSKQITADVVANGTGRVPDVERLNLDAAGIDHDRLAISVDQHLRSTSNPAVFVAGDALAATPQLSPVATHEGQVVADNMVHGATAVPGYAAIPAAIYTIPALAAVGLTEAEANDRGLKFTAKANDLAGWRSSMTYAETVAFSKVLVEDGSNRILGAHIVGHGSEEIIHLFAFAMKHGLTTADLADTVYAYPTFSSDIKFMI